MVIVLMAASRAKGDIEKTQKQVVQTLETSEAVPGFREGIYIL